MHGTNNLCMEFVKERKCTWSHWGGLSTSHGTQIPRMTPFEVLTRQCKDMVEFGMVVILFEKGEEGIPSIIIRRFLIF